MIGWSWLLVPVVGLCSAATVTSTPPTVECDGATSHREAFPGKGLGHWEDPVTLLHDSFDAGSLELTRWATTRKNDFEDFRVETTTDGRLRLQCSTIGTDDTTVKYMGVVTREPLDLSGERSLAVELDWNRQTNGSYLTAAVVLSPKYTEANPEEEPDWLKVEYSGVPPGRNARAAVWISEAGRRRWVYDEGWPDQQRSGRVVKRVRVEIRMDEDGWDVREDGNVLYAAQSARLPFARAYLYLQLTSHSNYPPREIFFDSVSLTSWK